MRGFQPAKAKAKAQPFVNGGPVRGPGTGTSDEIQDVVPNGTYVMPADSTAEVGDKALASMGADGVPVNLSNGEFKMPPEQVHAVGVQALDQIKNATHTPVGFAPGAQQGQEPEPRMFFADGGVVDDERRRFASVPASFGRRGNNTFGAPALAAPAPAPAKAASPAVAPREITPPGPNQATPSNIFPQSSPSAGAPIYANVGFSADQFGSSGKFAQVPDSIGQQPGRTPAPVAAPVAPAVPAAPQGMTATQRADAIGQIPTGGVAAPAAAAAGFNPNMTRQAQRTPGQGQSVAAAADPMLADVGKAPATLYMQDRAQEMRGQIDAGNYAGALGTAGRTAVQGLGMYGLDIANAIVTPALDVGGRMVGGLLGTDDAAGNILPEAGAKTLATPAAASTAGGGRGAVNPAPANPSAPAPVMQPQAQQVAPGIYRQGNAYGDSAAAVADIQARPAGLPSAQNMAAADALATGSPAAQGSRGFGPGGSASGSSSADAALSAARMAAAARGDMDAVRDSYFAQGQSFGGQTREGMEAERLKQLALSPMGTPGRRAAQQMYAQQVQAGTAREDRQATNSIAQQRLGLEAGELGMRQQAAGFEARAAQRIEDLQTAYQTAKPAERADLARQILELQGKGESGSLRDNFMAMGGGQEWDATAGVMRNVPQRLVDLRTGQEVGGGQGQAQVLPMAPKDQLKAGQIYQTPRGPARWDGKQFTTN